LLAGEISHYDSLTDARDLGYSPASDSFQVDRFPEEARALIAASEDLYFRLQRMSQKMRSADMPVPEPLAMIERLRASF
jgi:regulator of CtrA degradation